MLLADLFKQIKQFKLIMDVLSELSEPFLVMFVTLYAVYFEFVVLGELWFGGKISIDSAQTKDPSVPALYY